MSKTQNFYQVDIFNQHIIAYIVYFSAPVRLMELNIVGMTHYFPLLQSRCSQQGRGDQAIASGTPWVKCPRCSVCKPYIPVQNGGSKSSEQTGAYAFSRCQVISYKDHFVQRRPFRIINICTPHLNFKIRWEVSMILNTRVTSYKDF